jgi:beta-lactamase class A
MRFRRIHVSALAAAILALEPTAFAARQAPLALPEAEARMRQVIEKSGAEIAVYWRPLANATVDTAGSRVIAINARTRFHAASTMKVPIMVELYRQAHAGRLALDDTVSVTNTFTSIVDGSAYTLSATEDSDGEIYKAIGKSLSYRALNEAMITVSSNLAANLLIERLGAKAIQATVEDLRAGGMQVLRGVEDQKAFDRGMNNTTDALGLGTLLFRIGRGEAVTARASAEMVEVLARQQFNGGIPAGVPPGTKVAHKTGSITRIRHDAGIVYAPEPYVLVVLTRGIQDSKAADVVIAEISRIAAALVDWKKISARER